MRITSKGQVTIPQEIREKAGLLPNTEVEFALEDGVVVLRKAQGPTRQFKRWVSEFRGAAPVRMSTDEIMALTRGDA